MADDRNMPNPASGKAKAEGDRDVTERYDRTTGEGGGITNRPLEEEVANQDELPERGRTKREEHRREEQSTDPALPSNDPTLKTKI